MPSKTGLSGFQHRGVSVTWSTARKRYEGKVTVGKLPDGRYDRRNVYGKTPKAVKAEIEKLQADSSAKTVTEPGRKPTVEKWFRTYLTEIAPHDGKKPNRESTLDSYTSLCENWLFKRYGTRAIEDLTVADLDGLYAWMYREGKAPTTVLKMHAVIRRALTAALLRNLVVRNVAAIRDNPGSTAPRKRVRLSVDKTEAFLDELQRRPRAVRLRWMIAVAIGTRQGEALGLRWRYVDWDRGGVYIDWQAQRRKWRHGCTDPVACAAQFCRTKPCPPTWEHGCPRPDACKGKPAYCPQRVKATRWTHGCPEPTGVKHPPERCPQRRTVRRCRLHRRDECPPLCEPGCTGHAAQCGSRTGGGVQFVRPKALRAGDEDEEAQEFVALPPSLMVELRLHESEQEARRRALGDEWQDHDLVFPGDFGQPLDQKTDLAQIKEILAAIGVTLSGTHWSRRLSARLLDSLGLSMSKIARTLRIRDHRVLRGYIGEEDADTRDSAEAMEQKWFAGRKRELATVTPIRRTVARRARRAR